MKDLEHGNNQCSLSSSGQYQCCFSERPVKCFDNLVKKFDFNLIISNPKGSSNVKLGVTQEICTIKQEPKDSRNTS